MSSDLLVALVEANRMFLARVVGNVVSTIKNSSLDGKKILIVQPVTTELKDQGAKLVALDSIGAGAGEIVYCCRGREASFPWLPEEVPTEATIIAIVDEVHRSFQPSAPSGQREPQAGTRRKRQADC